MAGFWTTEKGSALGSTVKLAVLALASAGVVAGWGCGAKPSKQPGGAETMSETEPLRLEVGKPLLRDLAGGGKHTYLVRLEPGQYMRFVADQRGIDVNLKLIGPVGGDLRFVDSPNGKEGPERVSQVASDAGDYRIEVAGAEGAKRGQYEASLEWVRAATPEDIQVFEAERTYQEGEAFRRQSDFPAARARYEDAGRQWHTLGERGAEALTLYKVGSTYLSSGDPEMALDFYRRAAEVYKGAGDLYGEATTLNATGVVLRGQGKLSEAQESVQAALEIFRRDGSLFGEANTLNNLGGILEESGQSGPAIEAYQQASILWRKVPDTQNEAKSLSNLGRLLFSKGRRQEARDALAAASRAAQEGHDLDAQALALSHLGELDAREGRFSESRSNLEQALALQVQIKDDKGRAMSLSSLGMTLLKTGDLDGAKRTSEEALDLFRQLRDATSEATVISNLGRIEHARGHDQEALAQQQSAETLFERLGDREGMALSRFGVARSLARLGDLAGARRQLDSCLPLVEKLRDEEPGLDARAAYFAIKQDYWDLNVEILMRLHERQPKGGFDSRALEAAERRKARSLLDALRETRSRAEEEAHPELARQIREVERRLRILEAKRRSLEPSGRKRSDLDEVNRELRVSLARLDALRIRMSELSPAVGDSGRAIPLTSAQIQKSLADPRTLLLVYSLGEERSYLWTVDATSMASFPLAPRSEIEAAAQNLVRVLPRASREAEAAEKRASRALSQLILAPAAGRIASASRLIIVGDGALQRIPFAALPIPGGSESEAPRLLVEDHEVVSLPSVSVLTQLRKEGRKRGPLNKTQIAVLADPVFGPDDPRVKGNDRPKTPVPLSQDLTRSVSDLELEGLKRLPYTRREGESILDLTKKYQPFGAFDFNASRDLFTGGHLDDFDVIHIATHSLLDSEHPDLSGIVLSLVDSSGQPKDGYLRLHEIYGLHLKAQLVVLSACETGSGQELRGEGILGITRGFLSAGVPQLVVSLWKVEDDSTAELMRRLYHYLFEMGLPTGAALRQAQLSMLKEPRWSAPRHWAGFVFVGDYRRKPKDGGLEEQDAGGVIVIKKASSDLPPPDIPRDKPARPTPGNPGGGQ